MLLHFCRTFFGGSVSLLFFRVRWPAYPHRSDLSNSINPYSSLIHGFLKPIWNFNRLWYQIILTVMSVIILVHSSARKQGHWVQCLSCLWSGTWIMSPEFLPIYFNTPFSSCFRNYGPVPVEEHRKSTERGSSIPVGKSPDLPVEFWHFLILSR